MRVFPLLLVCAAAIPLGAALSAPPAPSQVGSAMIKSVTACRAISDSSARLACYDGTVDKLAAADEKGGLVVLDREDVHAARRSLFGFTVPKLGFLEGNADEKSKEADIEINATIRTAHESGYSDWIIVLDDGAVWQTSEPIDNYPRSGDKIRIKHAALGSYLANINGKRAVRIRRTG